MDNGNIESTWTDAPQALAERLIMIKNIFPKADAAQILLRNPTYMLREDPTAISEASDRLRELIPDINVDRCSCHSLALTDHITPIYIPSKLL
jgi:hypothetical protein